MQKPIMAETFYNLILEIFFNQIFTEPFVANTLNMLYCAYIYTFFTSTSSLKTYHSRNIVLSDTGNYFYQEFKDTFVANLPTYVILCLKTESCLIHLNLTKNFPKSS